MRIILAFAALFLFGCTSAQTYEEIVEGVMEGYSSDLIYRYFPMWVPIDAPQIEELESFNLSDEETKKSKQDQELCAAAYRGTKFKKEALAVALMMQCMNKKGWRWDTKVIIIISH